MITKLAPRSLVSLYIGIWYITLGLGGKLSGLLSGMFFIPENDLAIAKTNISSALIVFVSIGFTVSLFILLIRKIIYNK